ncbi:MAG: glutamate racemase [Hyphomicrobiales bacterium]
MTLMQKGANLLVVDSGVGGLSVARAIRKELPQANIIYAADYAAFPYGDWEADALQKHLIRQISNWIEAYEPDCVVIACNTASTLVLPPLREAFEIPIVGTVPAIKPAASLSRSGMISVLATPGTVKRDYTQSLLQEFAKGLDVQLVGSRHLAALSEQWFINGPSDSLQNSIKQELAPCFNRADGGAQTDTIVLGCTHFPLLSDILPSLAPWPVQWIDPSSAIARRVRSVIGKKAERSTSGMFEIISSAENKAKHVEELWEKLVLP